MFLVTINKPKHLLYFYYIGHVTAADYRRGAADVAKMLPDLAPGFRLLSDLSRVEKIDLNCVPEIGLMMELLDRHQVGSIVRVVPDEGKDIGFNIMSAFHFKTPPHAATFETIEEAAKLLAL